jgi:methyl-accepting chemotaxis protein
MRSYEVDLQSRRRALNVTSEVDALVASLAERAAMRVRPALQAYLDSWNDLPGFGAVIREHGPTLLEAEATYFTELFSREMDRGYLERLRAVHNQERATGFGVRVHLGAAAHVASVLFDEIGRRHRWSGRATARDCGALMRFLVVDCLNAFHFEQMGLKESVTARQASIGDALHGFNDAVTHLRAAMTEASGAFAETSSRTASAVGAALDASQRTSEAANQGASNLVSTAAASAQLVGSIDEVDRLANQSLDAVRATTSTVGSLREEIGELEGAAREIGSVVTMIAGIASQTNLLALNATIEAARAGEAGRGFSVVAAEVKSLAGQTAEATRDITAQVAAIQAASARSAEQLGRIMDVIMRVEEISAAAAAATSQQASATAAIADQARLASEAVATIQSAADGVRTMMQDLKSSMAAMDEASRRLSVNGERFDSELGRFSAKLTAA